MVTFGFTDAPYRATSTVSISIIFFMARGAKKAAAPALVLERAPHRKDGRSNTHRKSTKRGCLPTKCSIAAATMAFAMAMAEWCVPSRALKVPAHMLQSSFFEKDLLTTASASALLKLVKRMKDFPTNINDVQFYTTEREHIGEGTPLAPNESCTDPFKVPNANRSMCVLPGRIDVGRHYVLTGGVQAAREPFEWLVSRVQSFGRYTFDLSGFPEAAVLFSDPRFQRLAQSVCPADKQELDRACPGP